jgi:hypothetical protein
VNGEIHGGRPRPTEAVVPFFKSIIRMIKSRRMRWAGHVERMREKKNDIRIGYWWESQERITGKTKAYVDGQY